MLFSFCFIYFALCDETSTKICLYSTNLPDQCKDILSLDVSKITDLDSEIDSIKASKMILLFSPSISNTDTKINYKLKISTFSSSTSVNFTTLGKDGEKFNLDLTIDQFDSTSSIIQFEDCSLHFIGISQQTEIYFDWIEIYRCDISFSNIDNKIIAQAAVFDSAFSFFSEIIIEGGHRNPDFTIKTSENISVELKEYENVLNSNVRVIYTNPIYRDMEIIGSKQLSFYCSTNDNDFLSTVSLKDIENLYFIDSPIDYPTEYSMICHNIHNIHADETSIPATLLKATVTTSSEIYQQTNIFLEHYVDIYGNIECDVHFLQEPTADIQDRISVVVQGTVSSNLISINSSFIDLDILDLNIDMNKYMGYDPFIHCIGKGGVSSITSSTDYKGYVGFSRPLFNRDFDTFLSDEDISEYINVDLNYLMISSNSDGFESLVTPSLTFSNESFIHGFTKDDSVIDIFRLTLNPLVDTISISNPSLKPLKLCFNNDCKGGIKVGNDDLKDLSKGIIFKGMKNVLLESSSEIEIIDFSNLYEDLNISIYSTVNDSITVKSMNFNPNLLINYTYRNIKLPSIDADLTNLSFCNCSFISNENKIKTTSRTNLQVDSNFVINGYLSSHFESSYEVDQLSIQIDSFTAIRMNDSGFLLIADKEYAIDQTISKWKSILLKKDVFISDSLTLFGYSNNPTFNLSIETSKKNDMTFSLRLENWTQIGQSKKINVDHSLLPLQIVMTEPVEIDPIILYGKGKVVYYLDYSPSSTLCVCENPAEIDSFPNCQNSSNIITFSELNEYLKVTEFDDLTIIIAGSSKEDSKHPIIDMESISMKIINFTSEGSDKEFITLDNSKQLKNPQLTETYFDNIEIYAKSGSQSNEFIFGELSFSSSILNGFDQFTVKINYFICETEILNSFKEIYITDNLVITGDFDLSEKTIHFENDDNSEDLKAFISKDTSAVLGDGKVKIGKITFLIEKSDDFDIVLNIIGNQHISFKCEDNSKFELIPPIQVNRCQNVIFDFTQNQNKWPELPEEGSFLINFVELINTTLILQHEETPIQIESISGHSTIRGNSPIVGITGQISNSESSDLTLSFEKIMNGQCELKIDEMLISKEFTISLLQANLTVTVNYFGNNEDSVNREIEKDIRLKLYVGIDGFSSLQVKFIDEEVKFFPTVSVLLDIPSSVKLDSKELDDFCSRNYTVIKTPIDQDPDFSLDIIEPYPETHGLTEEAFSIYQDKATMETVFYTKVHPSLVPLSLCYSSSIKCEITIPKDQLNDHTALIPSGLKAVEFNVGADITDSLFLNLDLPAFDGISAEIKADLNKINVHLGKSRIEKLTINGVELGDMQADSYHVKKLVVTGSLIKTIDGFDEVDVTDYGSWMMKKFSSFSGDISFLSVASEITFDSDGWTIGDEKVKYSDFPNLKVNFMPPNGQLKFEIKSESLVPRLRIEVDPSVETFYVSKGWSNVEFKNKLNAANYLLIENITDENHFTVFTSSFPYFIYPLNVSQSESQVIKFENDIEISDDKISLKNTNLNIDNSNALVTINEIEFAEDSVFNNSAPININTLIVKEGNFSKINQVTVYEKLKVIGESEIEGQIDFDANENNEIEYIWDLDETPELLFTEFPKNVVKINVHFAKETVTDAMIPFYNDFLYQKAFRLGNYGQYCQIFNQNLQYISTFKYFNQSDSIFDSYCDDGELIIQGKRKIPTDIVPTATPTDSGGDDDDDSGGKNKRKLALIISLSIIIPLIVIGLAVVAILIYKKYGGCKFDIINPSESMEAGLLHVTSDSNSIALTPKYTETL